MRNPFGAGRARHRAPRGRGAPASVEVGAPAHVTLTDELVVAEESMVDTVALIPSGGIMVDPFLEGPAGDGPPTGAPGGHRSGVGGTDDGSADSLVGGIFQAGPLAVGGIVSNVLNVVATVLIARLLTTRQYGAVAQLLGLFFVMSMPGSALLVGVVRRIAARATEGREDEAHRWSSQLYRRAVLGVVVWAVVAAAVNEPLSHALRLPANGSVTMILIAGGVWLLLCIDRAILQAHRRYAGLGLNLVVEIAVRVVLALSLAAAGFGIFGFCLGLLLGEVGAAVHARLLSRRAWDYPARTEVEVRGAERNHALTADLVTALVGFGLIGILQNADIILVGRLAPANSGPYAAISVASKSLVFGAILLGSYVLPEAAIRWQKGEHALRQLAITLLFLVVPAAFLLALALFAPHQFLTIFFSGRLAGASAAFAPLVGAMACLGLVVLLTNYLFGAARRWVVVLLAVGVVCLIIRIHQAHGALVPTARAELEVQGGLALAMTVAFVAVHLRFRHPQPPGVRPTVGSVGGRSSAR